MTNVLMISGDPKALQKGSGVYKRLLLQEAQVDRLDVYVPGEKIDVPLDGTGGVHGFSGGKLAAARAMLRAGKCLERMDVVTAQDPFYLGLVAWRVARAKGAALNLQLHADLSAQPLAKRALARFLLRRADSVRVVSEKLKRQVEALGVKASITVLPVYVDVLRFKGVVALPHARKTVLWVGRFEEEKDPLAAIEIFKEVRKEVDAQLVMLGDGTLAPAARRRAEAAFFSGVVHLATGENDAEAPVRFPGWQNVVHYLDTADVVLSTSRHESWGASIVEALAAGVPVVSPDVGVAQEAGAVVVPREKLASAVIDVLKKGVRGSLKLDLPTEGEWARRWRDSLR